MKLCEARFLILAIYCSRGAALSQCCAPPEFAAESDGRIGVDLDATQSGIARSPRPA